MSHPNTVDLVEVNKLTPRALLRLLRLLTLGSWILLIGMAGAGFAGAFGLGISYEGGTLPETAYVLHTSSPTPRERRTERETQQGFASNYSEIVNWQTLRAIADNIMEKQPDGLDTHFEVVAALLSQIRATRGYAVFLAGDTEFSVKIKRLSDGFELEWDEYPSVLRRVARDASYELSDKDVRVHNANLNWTQFTYLDDAMKHAVIFRNLTGTFGLIIRE